MCGIAGIVARNPAQSSREAVEKMLQSIRHRGPDGCGVRTLGLCTLGNVRLAIVDLSDRGRQPMSSEDGAVAITYNGECYNAAEWRDFLQARGHTFHSSTDTEVVLHLYLEFGDRFLEKLRGMFAVAIWDARRNRLLLGRDRLGIKPLYIAPTSDRLIFASEIRAFPASGFFSPRLDSRGVHAFLELGHIPPPWSPLQGVEPLAPGEMAVWEAGALHRSIYWNLISPDGDPPMPDRNVAVAQVREILLDAARLHRMSDVPVGLFLSGGVDSAAVASLMRSTGDTDVTALTVGFEESEFDESELSRTTAGQLGLAHRVLRLSASEMAASLDHAITAMDQPTMDGLNTFWISQAASSAGFKVALSGQGGDELFGGYSSLRWFEDFQRAATAFQYLPTALGAALFDHKSFPMRWRKLSLLFGADDPFIAAQAAVRTLFPESDVDGILAPPLRELSFPSAAMEHLEHWAGQVSDRPLLEKIAYLDFRAHLQPRLLRDGDAMSMSHSLELRPLFLDHAVVECVMALPAALRMDHKRLLLDALSGIMPEKLRAEIAARPKRTFTFPFARWFSGAWRGALDEAFIPEHVRATGVFQPDAVARIWGQYRRAPHKIGWSRIWTLFVLQRWCELTGVRS